MKTDETKFLESCIAWYKEQVKWYEDGLRDTKGQLTLYKKMLAKAKSKPKSKAKPSVR